MHFQRFRWLRRPNVFVQLLVENIFASEPYLGSLRINLRFFWSEFFSYLSFENKRVFNYDFRHRQAWLLYLTISRLTGIFDWKARFSSEKSNRIFWFFFAIFVFQLQLFEWITLASNSGTIHLKMKFTWI